MQEVEPGHARRDQEARHGRRRSTFTAAAAAALVLVRAHLFLARQRRRHLPRAQGAGRPARRPGAEGDRTATWGNTVFSFIPNTAEVAYYGLMSALRARRRDEVKQRISQASRAGKLDGGAARRADPAQLAARREGRAARTSRCARSSARRSLRNSSRATSTTSPTARCSRPGQPGVRGRLDRARHDAAAIDPAHTRAAQPEEDRHRLDRAADPLSGLLRHRHVGDRQIHRVRGGRVAAQGTRPAWRDRGSLPALPRRAGRIRARRR